MTDLHHNQRAAKAPLAAPPGFIDLLETEGAGAMRQCYAFLFKWEGMSAEPDEAKTVTKGSKS